MADNIELNLGVGGKIVATDDIGGIQHELVKVEFGTDGNATMVSTGNPLPVTDAATEVSVASIDLKTPTVGQKAMAASSPVVIASDQSAVPVSAASLPLPALASTSTKQSDGSQKSQIVDGIGNVIGATSNALDINIKSGSITPSGTQDENLKQVNGATVNVGIGSAGTGTQRVSVSNDSTIGLVAGVAIIGKVGIDQTTPGTTNGVQINAALPAGSNVIGHVIVDASSAVIGHVIVDSGTITAVTAITNALPVGSNVIGKTSIDQTTPGTTNLVALTAETTKAIGVVRTSDGAGNLLTSNSSTFSAKFALDGNLLGTLGTAFSTAGKVDVKSTQSFTDATVVVLAVTALQSIASSATVGWQSLLVKNHVTKYNDFKVFVKLTTANTAPASDKAMYVWLIPWYTNDNGTTFNPSSIGTTTLPTGTDAAMTIASPNNMRLLGVLNYTTAQGTVQDSFLISNCWGNTMLDGFSIGVTNFSGAALSTGCIVDYTGVTVILT